MDLFWKRWNNLSLRWKSLYPILFFKWWIKPISGSYFLNEPCFKYDHHYCFNHSNFSFTIRQCRNFFRHLRLKAYRKSLLLLTACHKTRKRFFFRMPLNLKFFTSWKTFFYLIIYSCSFNSDHSVTFLWRFVLNNILPTGQHLWSSTHSGLKCGRSTIKRPTLNSKVNSWKLVEWNRYGSLRSRNDHDFGRKFNYIL